METEEPPLPPNPDLLNRQPKWFKPVFYGAVISSCIFGIGLVLAPMMIRKRGPHPGKDEMTNIRQIGIALLEFETDYGYPNETTVALIAKNYPAHGYDLSGSSSNALFRQLFAVEIAQAEEIFYARILGAKKPDGVISTGNILAPGEVGFSFIAGRNFTDDPLTPLVLTPLIPGTTRFDPKPFNGKAVILHIDCSARFYDIAKDGHVYDKGINLLSPKHPIWKGKAPDIRYPEL